MSCATVPTAISESALATLSQIENSAASNASPSHRAAKPQTSVIENLRSAFLRARHGGNQEGTPAPTLSGVSRRHHQPCGGCGRNAISPSAYWMIPERRRFRKPRRMLLAGNLCSARLGRLPALGGLVVGGSRLDPARALRSLLLLPERRPRLQVVHDEFAGREGLAAMRSGDDDEHDLVARLQLTDAMYHERLHHVPSLLRLGDNFLERLLGHAGIMLECHLRHRAAVVCVAAHADEARNRAYFRIAPPQRRDLGAGVEILSLNAHRHFSLRSPEEKTRLHRPASPASSAAPLPG